MSCGCKNKGNQTQQQIKENTEKTSETIKSAIKKTVEKYYYSDKKSNGWTK
jgi:hypothetical protein